MAIELQHGELAASIRWQMCEPPESHIQLTHGFDMAATMNTERRRRERLKLRCSVEFSRRDNHPITAETDDLSVDGFYCMCAEPLSPGEHLQCQISLPEGRDVALYCQVKVVRVEVRGLEPGFGIACQFEDRRVAVA